MTIIPFPRRDVPKGVVFEPDDPDHNYQTPTRPSPPSEAGFSLEPA